MVTIVTQIRFCLFSFRQESLGYDKCLNFNFESWNFKYEGSFKFWILKNFESLSENF
jgi:hypothetical protein